MTRTTLRRRAPLVLAAGAALTLIAAPAFSAVTVTVVGSTLTITGDGADDTAAVTCVGGDVQVNDIPVTPTTACSSVSVVSVDSGTGSGDDRVDLRAVNAPPFAVGLVSSVTTGGGQDQIFGGTTVNAGDGNDRFINGVAGPTTINGGGGVDSVEYDFTGVDTSASYTLTSSGLTATVGPTTTNVSVQDVEQYVFSMPDGSTTADVSTIDARASSARVVARMHSGIDTFYGGAGDDVIDAGPGDDGPINPGAGNDTVNGGPGADTINVQDGQVDVVDCGGDVDTVVADRNDVLTNCENVTLPPLPPPAPTPAPETGGVVGLKKLPRGAQASFVFVSPTAGATFQCRVDAKNWKTCRSPYKLRTSNLGVGKHKFYVRAVLTGNNVDASPSKFGFTLQKPKPKKRR